MCRILISAAVLGCVALSAPSYAQTGGATPGAAPTSQTTQAPAMKRPMAMPMKARMGRSNMGNRGRMMGNRGGMAGRYAMHRGHGRMAMGYGWQQHGWKAMHRHNHWRVTGWMKGQWNGRRHGRCD